jgi:hypothetical protein
MGCGRTEETDVGLELDAEFESAVEESAVKVATVNDEGGEAVLAAMDLRQRNVQARIR